MGFLLTPLIWIGKQVIVGIVLAYTVKAAKNATSNHVLPKFPLATQKILKKLGIRPTSDFATMEEWERQVASTYEGREAMRLALKEIDTKHKKFYSNYRIMKAKSKLKTDEEVAKASGISIDVIKKIEQETEMPSAFTVAQLAIAFNCSIEDLISR